MEETGRQSTGERIGYRIGLVIGELVRFPLDLWRFIRRHRPTSAPPAR